MLLLLLLLLPLARADADARALASPTERTLLSAASASSSWVAPICASPEVNCDDPDQTPEWARDVEALQALRRDCDPDAGTFIGDRGWHSEPWDAVATFAGTKSEWTTLACSSDAPTSDVNCDGDGRVRRFAPKRLALRCASLPPEFAALTRLLELEIEGQYRLADWPTMDAFLAPAVDLAALETLRVKTSSVRGALPDLCGAGLLPHLRTLDIETPLETLGGEGLACLSNLETLRLAGLALRGAHALPDAWKALTRLETLELRDVTAAPGVWEPADANAIGPLPNAWFEEISSGEATDGDVIQRGMRSLATLDAQESGLVGTIPRAIGKAPLQRLILRANDLVGTIPASFANLTALVEFDARENALAGEIPPDAFAGAAALREVRLSGNAFRGALPASLLGGPTKEALELVDVANQGHDDEGFEGPLPDFDAPNLLTFLAGENALAGPLPASLGSGAPNLETLDLSHNAIDGAFPDSMDRLASLKSVNVRKNQLTGGLENGWLGVSSHLETINLSRNDFGSVPEVLCGPGTTTLDVSDNPRLVGGVGEALDQCVELRELLLGMVWESVEEGEAGEEEDAEGSPGDPSSPSDDDDPSSPAPLAPLAATFAGLVRLETVSLRGLGLTGTIPPALFELTTLKSLDLSDNRLAGEIPDASRLASLETLRLGGNRLEGLVPASLLTSTKLTRLNAPGNRLTGIEDVDASSDDGSPSFTSSSVVLSDALLSDNAFSAFPGALRRHAATLRVVDLANNRDMSGPVPPWVGAECVSLTHLNLRGCALSGPIGAWLGDAHELTRLRVLDLRGASEVARQDHRGPLTGAATVRAMNLTTLRLDHQRRFGANVLSALSVEGFALGRLETLTARGAGMTGALPSRLFGPDAAPRLETLDLRDNEIEGVVPSASGGDSDSSSGSSSSSSSSSGSSFSHPLRELRLANNSFDDLAPFPALPHGVVLSGAADFADATETETGFACPLPSADAVYASVACTCAGGHFAPTVYLAESESEPESESAPGSVEDASGRFACEPCAPGTFVPEEVPAAADDEANDAANDALAALSAIFPESSSDLSSPLRTFPALRCAACANGTASPHPGATACSPCPPGAFSPVPARDRCDACAPGTFSASAGASGACASCPPGRIAPESGATACAPCDAGSSPNANGDACEPCASGSFAAARGSETCAPCPEGQYVALEGAAKCALCPPGTSRGVEGGRSEAECVPCPGGTNTEGASGAARCVACEPGTFAEGILDEGGLLADAEDGAEVYGPSAEDGGPNASQSSPSQNHSPPPPAPPPPPSAAAAIVGASRCSPSPAGAFVADRGAVRATACAPGTFAPQAGMVACVACAAGRFAPEPGSTACLACPPGSESDEGADRCRCLPGHAPGAVSGGGLRCDPCAPGTFFASDALVGSASSSGTTPHPGGGCSPCAAGTFADKNASVRCDAFSPGAAGADFIHPETRTGARAQVHCAPGTVARQELIPGTLHVAVGCVECPDGTVASAVGSLRCEACARGSVANDERTACVGVSEDTAGPLGVFAGLGDDSNGDEGGAQYNDTLAARVANAANSGRFAGTRGATAFFVLLGVVTLIAGAFLRWRRLRRERLRELALEREVLLEEAEAEMCERGAVRRKTLYALAGVDAEAAEVETSAVLDLGDEKRFSIMAAADEAAAASNTHRTRSRAATGARRGRKVPKVPWFLGWLFPRRGRGRDRASDSSPFESSDDDDDGRLDSISPESARARAAGAVRRRKTRAYSRAAGAFPKEGKKYYRTAPSDASTAPEDDPYALADAFLGVVPDRRSRAVSSARRGAELTARRISARSRVRAASRAMAHEREEEEGEEEEQTREYEDDARGVISGGVVVSEGAGPDTAYFPRKKKNIAAADSRPRGPPRGTAGADGSSGGSRGGRGGDSRGVVPKRSGAASEAFDRRSGGEEEDAAASDDAPSDAEGRRVEAAVLRAMRRASAAGMIPGGGDPAGGEPGGGVRGGGEVALLPPVPERD